MSVILFIDANQYLELYGLIAGKRLLDSLEEQKAHIFVSMQIVDEVLRRKLGCAQIFFSNKLKEVSAMEAPVPDHLLGISEERMREFRTIFQQAKEARDALTQHMTKALIQISRSEDDVSVRLGAIFDKALSPTAGEVHRARERKERGNPPGEQTNPLGDQLVWEQLLTRCKDMKCTGLWIVTRDSDFGITWKRQFLLNSLLYRDLTNVCGAELQIHCFSDLLTGLEDFGKNAGVKAEKLPTEKEAKEIRREIEGLPPIGWMEGMRAMDDAAMVAIRAAQLRQQYRAAIDAGSTWPPNSGISLPLAHGNPLKPEGQN
jgi:PIN domain-containing protein